MNSDIVREIFSEYAIYCERPFSYSYCGIDSIISYWNDIKQRQKDVSFGYELLSDMATQGIAHWKASFTEMQISTVVKLDGIMVVTFDHHGKCKLFREWWHSTKSY